MAFTHFLLAVLASALKDFVSDESEIPSRALGYASTKRFSPKSENHSADASGRDSRVDPAVYANSLRGAPGG